MTRDVAPRDPALGPSSAPDRGALPIGGSRTAPARWRPIEILAVPAGWAVALSVEVPAVLPAGAGDRWAPLLVLAATLPWWAAVVVVIRSDLRDFLIPDGASLAIAALGVAVAVGAPLLAGAGRGQAALAGAGALSAGAVAFALFFLIGAAFRRCGRDALGFGDVKLAGASAIWLAPADAALALEIAALGAIAALLLTRRDGALRDTPVPFGAFMAPAAWLVFVLAPAWRGGAGTAPW